jgi:hypothetical protein
MKTPAILALAAASLCLLAGCGPKGGQAASQAGAAAPAGGASGAAPAQGGPDTVLDFSALPHPRAGLWQTVTDAGDGHPETTTSCFSGAMPSIKKPTNCSQVSFKRTFTGAIVADMDCGSPDGAYHMSSHSVGSGDFQSTWASDGVVTLEMRGRPAQVIKTHSEAKYVGPCPPGENPVDEIGPSTGATG